VTAKGREIMLNPMSQPTGVVVKLRTLQRRLEFLPCVSEAGSTLNGSGELRVGGLVPFPSQPVYATEVSGVKEKKPSGDLGGMKPHFVGPPGVEGELLARQGGAAATLPRLSLLGDAALDESFYFSSRTREGGSSSAGFGVKEGVCIWVPTGQGSRSQRICNEEPLVTNSVGGVHGIHIRHEPGKV
jgi:hypothetical protein